MAVSRAGIRRIILAFPAILAFTGALGARQWPDEPNGVVQGFGGAVAGGFSRGIAFASTGQRVRAWSDGEVIWRSQGDGDPCAVSGGGLVVLEHSGGFRSAYNGVEARPDLGDFVSGDDWLGYSEEDSWSFVITDTQRSRIIDPITLLPVREGLPAAELGFIGLERGGETAVLSNGLAIVPGRWSFVMDSAAAGTSGAMPAEISLYWVGIRVGGIRFDSLGERDGVMIMDTPDPLEYDAVYDSDGRIQFRDILLNAGRGILELRLRDETGRVVTKSWTLTVRES